MRLPHRRAGNARAASVDRLGAGAFIMAAFLFAPGSLADVRGTGDLGLIVERESGRVQIVETSTRQALGAVEGLGDLSHASAVFSRDQRYAYVFGRDGGLSKIDLLERRLDQRVVQAGNSIGGAISQNGRLIAVANYEPGGVRVFDAGTLAPVADLPATYGPDERRSRVVGLEDAPGQRFVYSLFDADEIRSVDLTNPTVPVTTRYERIGRAPYDGLVTLDGRWYLAGLFGEDGLALLDLWHPDAGVRRVLDHYGRGTERLPVYKMPHLEGWAIANGLAFLPAVGRHQVLVVDTRDWRELARIDVAGQPVFVMARPDGRQIWVNFAMPANDRVQVIDVATLRIIDELRPGRAVLHMEFTPRGEEVWISARDDHRVLVYDTESRAEVARLAVQSPSGIFFSARAHRIGL